MRAALQCDGLAKNRSNLLIRQLFMRRFEQHGPDASAEIRREQDENRNWLRARKSSSAAYHRTGAARRLRLTGHRRVVD